MPLAACSVKIRSTTPNSTINGMNQVGVQYSMPLMCAIGMSNVYSRNGLSMNDMDKVNSVIVTVKCAIPKMSCRIMYRIDDQLLLSFTRATNFSTISKSTKLEMFIGYNY